MTNREAIVRLIKNRNDEPAERHLLRRWRGPFVVVYEGRPYAFDWGQNECGSAILCVRRFARYRLVRL